MTRPMLLVNSQHDFTPIEQQEDMLAALDAAFGNEPNYEGITLSGNDHAWLLWPVIISGTETVKDRAMAFFAGIFGSPWITTQPADKTVTAGMTAKFNVRTTGTSPLRYQWRKNGSNITGATQRSYTTPPTTAADNGSLFSVIVSNHIGSVTSNNATLTVY